MEIETWYCPRCDKSTWNWRKCPTCKDDAVFQRFILWAVEHKDGAKSPPACYINTTKRTHPSTRRLHKIEAVQPQCAGHPGGSDVKKMDMPSVRPADFPLDNIPTLGL